jgi:hypothetical protein
MIMALFRFHRLYFQQGSRRVFLQTPSGTTSKQQAVRNGVHLYLRLLSLPTETDARWEDSERRLRALRGRKVGVKAGILNNRS